MFFTSKAKCLRENKRAVLRTEKATSGVKLIEKRSSQELINLG